MKTKSLHYLKVGLASAAFFGIVAIAFAAPTTWTAPTAAAPGSNVAAPVNISSTAQVKPGMLDVTGFNNWGTSYFSGSVQIASGSPATGKVLTSTDALGHTAWETLGTGTGGSSQWTTSGSNIYNNNTANVGVGSTTPSDKLAVNGTSPNALLSLQSGGSTMWHLGVQNSTGDSFQIGDGATLTPELTIAKSTGNAAFTGNLTVAGKNVCRQDGTNCPGSASAGPSVYKLNPRCSSGSLTAGTDLKDLTLTPWCVGVAPYYGTWWNDPNAALPDVVGGTAVSYYRGAVSCSSGGTLIVGATHFYAYCSYSPGTIGHL